jgi:hypothetical protein
MRMTQSQCAACSQWLSVAQFSNFVNVCDTCLQDESLLSRLTARADMLQQDLVAHIEALSDEDMDRWSNIWIAQQQLAQPPVYEPYEKSLERAKERDKLVRMLARTMQKGDAISTCMRIQRDLKRVYTHIKTVKLVQGDTHA